MTPGPSDRYVLGELKVDGARLQLLAYEREGVVWIGLSSPSGGGGVGLHTGSRARDVETTASIGPDWSVAWGGISPRVARAEIRNDDGEVFPVRILALPAELSRDDRAIWGLAERCDQVCDIIGYDGRGELLRPGDDLPVAPRTHIAEGEDPIGGHWRLTIARSRLGTSLELRHAWGGEPVPLHAPGQGFGEVSVGRGWNDLARGHSVLGIVSDRAARVVVRTAARDDLEAVVLAVPDVGSAMKAFVAFTAYNEAPRSISALDQDEAIVAMHDLPPS
jgi:hypothetical protein